MNEYRESIDLDKLQKICDASTKGPWYRMYVGNAMRACDVRAPESTPAMICNDVGEHDAEFIAAAHSFMPLLIQRVRDLESAIGHFGPNEWH